MRGEFCQGFRAVASSSSQLRTSTRPRFLHVPFIPPPLGASRATASHNRQQLRALSPSMPRGPSRLRQQSRPVSPIRGSGQNNNKPNPRVVQNQRLAHKPLGKRNADSDDSDELVTKGQGRTRGRPVPTVEVYASGALGTGDKPNSHPTRAQRRKQFEQARRNGTKAQTSPSAPSVMSQAKTPRSKPSPLHASEVPSPAPAVQSPQTLPYPRPTPLREDSILNGIKPRKRQNSILMEASLDESTMGSFALPEDENSPLHLPKQKQSTESPRSQPPSATSSSKKRKLGLDDLPSTAADASRTSNLSTHESAPEPELPTQSIHTLRTPGQKQRRRTLDQDEADIMAPPMSSSSEHSSPAKPAPVVSKRSKAKAKAPPAALSTQELQAQLMPAKPQKVLRARNKRGEFDISSDSPENDEQPPEGEDDSTFLGPSKRRSTQTTRRQPSTAPAKSTKSVHRAAPDKNKKKAKTKQSTTPAPLLLASTRSRRAVVPSSEEEDPPAKSPSQLSIISVASPPQRTRPRDNKSTAGKARRGGSPLKWSLGKENLGDGDDDESVSGGSEGLKLPSPRKQYGGKWAEIDDFEMDFEDVVVGDVSSDPLAR